MKIKTFNVTIACAAILFACAKPLDLASLKFEKGNGSLMSLPNNFKGYLIYYLDPEEDCTVCISDLENWNRYQDQYTNIFFASLLIKDRRQNSETYKDVLGGKIRFEGLRLYDPDSRLKKALNLGAGSCVVVLDQDRRLLNIIRYQDIQPTPQEYYFKDRNRFFHRLLSMLNN